jgi:hypothetical protein
MIQPSILRLETTHAIWSKVSLIRDVDDPAGKAYGAYLTRKTPPPDPEKIKSRRI